MIDNGVVITTPRTYRRKITLDDRRFVERLDWLDSDRVYRRTMKMYEERAYGFWAVILAETGDFAGLCGLLDQRVEGRYELELGYHLLLEYPGRGLATEAARAVMDYAFQSLGTKRLISIILPDNAASIGVAKKNGLVFEREAVFRGLVVSVFAVHNVCWASGAGHMSEIEASRGNSDFHRVAALLKLAAYALAVGGLFTWLILDKPSIGVAMLLAAAADGFASVFFDRRAVRRKQQIDKER